jgi:hypothetical protein
VLVVTVVGGMVVEHPQALLQTELLELQIVVLVVVARETALRLLVAMAALEWLLFATLAHSVVQVAQLHLLAVLHTTTSHHLAHSQLKDIT